MNKAIKILLSVAIVSLSVFLCFFDENKWNLRVGSETLQINNICAQSIENSVKECIYKKQISINIRICDEKNIEEQMQQEMLEIKYIEDQKEWFLAYKDIIFKYIKWIEVPQTIFDVYTEEEITLMCRTVETECYDQDFASKCNVASIIFNRIEQGGEFGNSVTEVITKENQFAYGRENITQDTILSIMYVYEIGDTTDECIAFRSDCSPETWYGWKYSFTDDAGHHFYK